MSRRSKRPATTRSRCSSKSRLQGGGVLPERRGSTDQSLDGFGYGNAGGGVLPERRGYADQSLSGFGYGNAGGGVLPERRGYTDQSLGGFGYGNAGGGVLPERRGYTDQSLGGFGYGNAATGRRPIPPSRLRPRPAAGDIDDQRHVQLHHLSHLPANHRLQRIRLIRRGFQQQLIMDLQ